MKTVTNGALPMPGSHCVQLSEFTGANNTIDTSLQVNGVSG
jgi:hypothetical protein